MTIAAAIAGYLTSLVSILKTIFLYTALLVIGPWLAALAYDLLLYAWRWGWHEMPVVGGRARGRPAPTHGREPRLVAAAVAAGGMPLVPAVLPIVVGGGGDEGEEAAGEGDGGRSAAKRRRQREQLLGDGD